MKDITDCYKKLYKKSLFAKVKSDFLFECMYSD